MKQTLAKEIVINALILAVWRRKPTTPVLVHLDQGHKKAATTGYDSVKPTTLNPA